MSALWVALQLAKAADLCTSVHGCLPAAQPQARPIRTRQVVSEHCLLGLCGLE